MHKIQTNETCQWNKNDCTSNYSLSKHLAELEIIRGQEEGLQTVIVNPSGIIGPSNRVSGTALIFKSVLNGNRYYPIGSNSFVDVNDVAKIMIELMNSKITREKFDIVSVALIDFIKSNHYFILVFCLGCKRTFVFNAQQGVYAPRGR